MIRGLGVLLAWILAAVPAPGEVPGKPASWGGPPEEDKWGDTNCRQLAGSGEALLEQVVERLEERLAMAAWDASLAGPGQQRYLEAVATETAEDLIGIVSDLWVLRDLPGEPEPSPAELYSLLGDLFLVTERPQQAIEAYRRAIETAPGKAASGKTAPGKAAPGKATRCAASYDGKIYTFEIVHSRITAYLLSRDPETGQVLERFLLPAQPIAFSIGRDGLDITFSRPQPEREPRSIRLAEQRLDYPIWVPDNIFVRFSYGSLNLARDFMTRADGTPSPELAPRGDATRDPSVDLSTLEAALRQVVLHDPTQPWNLFVLGQCLWTQGRRSEAIATWEDLFAGEFQAVPYYEFTKMAWYFELYRHPEWADAAFREALARRRNLPLPVTRSYHLERWVNFPTRRMVDHDQWPELDVERAYLWWLRLRQISGVSEGDGFRAVLWANYFKSIGDTERSAAELAYFDRVRQTSMPPLIAYLDYAIWFLAAAAGLLFVYIALSIKSLLWWFFRWSLKAEIIRTVLLFVAWLLAAGFFSGLWYTPDWFFSAFLLGTLILLSFFSFLPLIRPALRSLRPSLSGAVELAVDLIPLLVFGVSLAALSLTTLYIVRVHGAPIDLADVLELQPPDTEDAPQEQRFEAALANHRIGDFQRARQLYESLPATPQVRQNLSALANRLPPLVSELVPYRPRVDRSALIREWIRDESWQPWRIPHEYLYSELRYRIVALVEATSAPAKYFFATNVYGRIATLAGPPALLLALFLRPVRRWLGRVLLILIPGAVFLRRGQVVRAYLVLWLFFFAAGPSCWLLLAETSDPAFVDAFGPHPSPGVFSSYGFAIPEDDFALPPPRYAQLMADNFWSLLWVYPDAGRFYLLVALALSIVLFLHCRQIPEILGPSQEEQAVLAVPYFPVKIGRRILPYDLRFLPYGRRRLPCGRRLLTCV